MQEIQRKGKLKGSFGGFVLVFLMGSLAIVASMEGHSNAAPAGFDSFAKTLIKDLESQPGDPLFVQRAGCPEPTCCEEAAIQGKDEGDGGGVVCCYGVMSSCVWNSPEGSGEGQNAGIAVVDQCIEAHEDDHQNDVTCTGAPGPERPYFDPGKDQDAEECHAYGIEIQCLRDSLSSCNSLQGQEVTNCQNEINGRLTFIIDYGNQEYSCNPALQ